MEEENKKESMGYHIDGNTFYNPFLAFLHGAHNAPNEHPKFVCYDSVFKDLDWTKEPRESVRELIDARARQLAQRYEKIIICFSGGTDSVTLYNSFVRQNIFIDEVIIHYSRYTTGAHPVSVADWLIKNHPDKRTRITVLNKNDPRYYTKFDNDRWVLENQGSCNYFFLTSNSPYIYQHCSDTWGNTNWVTIFGYEKPHILRENNQWVAVHLDKVVKHGLGYSNLEYFYITPDFPQLHLKQAHMLLRYIKKTYPGPFENGWSSVAVCGKKSNEDYVNYAAACGLDSEIKVGQGFLQKKYNDLTRFRDMEDIMNNQFEYLQNIDPVLKEKLLLKDKTAKNFMDGWQSLQNDNTLVEYMVRHKLLSDNTQSVEHYNGLWGEKYLLEDN
jgi:hypothetical protein